MKLVENLGVTLLSVGGLLSAMGSCHLATVDALSSKISECVGAVTSWMESNRLSLNCDKTEVVWCATSRRQHQLPYSALSVDGTLVKPLRSARDLGIYTDADLVMRDGPANGFAVFRRPPPVAPDPSLSADRHVPDTGGQPCANSFGLWQQCPGWPSGLLGPTTPVSAEHGYARLTYHLRRSDHISEVLACLHWLRLRVPKRIEFKIAVLTYNVVHGLAPGYLGSFARAADLPSRRSLRSVGTNRLVVLTSRLSIVGSRAFLPVACPQSSMTFRKMTSAKSLTTFRRLLKIHLFRNSFPDYLQNIN